MADNIDHSIITHNLNLYMFKVPQGWLIYATIWAWQTHRPELITPWTPLEDVLYTHIYITRK